MMVKYILLFIILVMSQIAHATDTNTDKEVRCLASAVYFEAAHSNQKMQEAVAGVVLNRASDDRYPDTVCKVVHQKIKSTCQFSWYCNKHTITNYTAWLSSLAIAKQTFTNWLANKSYDITNGATNFHDHRITPRWSHNMTKLLVVDNMSFYK